MKRIDSLDRYPDKFGAGKDGWADENLLTGIGGTFFRASWADHVQEEIANVIEGEGIALNPAAYNQLRTAIQQMDATVAAAAKRDADLICASTWRREGSGLPATDVRGVAHDGARRWCVVGDAGLIATSDDMGETWTTRTPGSGFGSRFNAVFFAAGLFVAVGQSAEVQTSPDGVTWTSRNSAGGPTLEGVTYDGTNWVAVGDNGGAGYVITAAAAAVTWTVRTAPTSSVKLYAVASDGAGKVVAVGDRSAVTVGLVAVSNNGGVTWTSELAPTGISDLLCITRSGDGWFYAAGLNGDIIACQAPTGAVSSTDWTVVRNSSSEPGCYGIVAPGDGLIVCARGALTSDPVDPLVGHAGVSFRSALAPTSEGAFNAHYARGMIVVGLDGGGVLRSLVFGHRLPVI